MFVVYFHVDRNMFVFRKLEWDDYVLTDYSNKSGLQLSSSILYTITPTSIRLSKHGNNSFQIENINIFKKLILRRWSYGTMVFTHSKTLLCSIASFHTYRLCSRRRIQQIDPSSYGSRTAAPLNTNFNVNVLLYSVRHGKSPSIEVNQANRIFPNRKSRELWL